MRAATPARLADAAEVPKKSPRFPGSVVAMPSTLETATASNTSGEASGLPSSAKSNSDPAPDEENASLSGALKPKAGVSATLTAPTAITPGVKAWPKTVPTLAPLIVIGSPLPAPIILINPGSEPDSFSIAI